MPADVKPRTRTLVESRKLLQVVTDPNTPGAAAYDAAAKDIANVSWVVSVYVAVSSARDDSTQPKDMPLSYTMYASVSGCSIT